MLSIAKFTMEFNTEKEVYYVNNLEVQKPACPVCGNTLIRKGRPERGLIRSDGEKIKLKVQRHRCKGCKKTHRELPGIIVPYKRHCMETIEGVIEGDAIDACCEGSTILRIKAWWIAMQLYIKSVLESIKEKYGIDLKSAKKLGAVVRALANTHSWPGTRSAVMPGRL